jgi:hypothetical protein
MVTQPLSKGSIEPSQRRAERVIELYLSSVWL